MWVRRLFTDPVSGELAATDARRRDFPPAARMFLTVRDQVCRTPWCGSPIRHADHAIAVAKGGDTDLRNGNGRCARCNLTKDLRGWATQVRDGTIVTTTPTGHRYRSRPPGTADLDTLDIDINGVGALAAGRRRRPSMARLRHQRVAVALAAVAGPARKSESAQDSVQVRTRAADGMDSGSGFPVLVCESATPA